MAAPKEFDKIIRAARRQNWRVEQSGGGHLKWFSPDGHTLIVTSSTPSDYRAFANLARDLRRAGLVW